MGHNSSKVLMGSHGSSDIESTCENADPATYVAGLAVRSSGGGLSLSSGRLIGVSLGKSLSDTKKTSVCRTGNFIPVQITDEGVQASLIKNDLTFTAVEKGEDGNDISITFVDDGAGAVEVTVDGTDIVVEMDDTALTGSTAAAIAAALEASEEAMALISVEVAEGEEDTVQAAFSIDNLESGEDSFPYVVIGQPLEVSATTGKAVSDDVLTGAIYVSNPMKGIDPITKDEIDVALIDMGGGL